MVRDFRVPEDRETIRPTTPKLAPGEFISGNGERCRMQTGGSPAARCQTAGREVVVSDIISGSH
ncbi:hypothetical protein Salmuc_03311 [Salipiger mucosus DSM 16094]|uniref:Uncharacterized protein n=1 Tax=Salipiger mucosus DSM 16094 TaxID=1123237 RepID=S9RVI4_9RHOB|nr:hypothetical protein Salmuc_03311 [Salipiger mucosus DSM 16094]